MYCTLDSINSINAVQPSYFTNKHPTGSFNISALFLLVFKNLFIVSFRLLWNIFYANPWRVIVLMMSHINTDCSSSTLHDVFNLLQYISGFYFFSRSHLLFIVMVHLNVPPPPFLYYRGYSHSLSLLKHLLIHLIVVVWKKTKILPLVS